MACGATLYWSIPSLPPPCVPAPAAHSDAGDELMAHATALLGHVHPPCSEVALTDGAVPADAGPSPHPPEAPFL